MPCNVIEPGIPLTIFFFNGARPNVSVQAYKQKNKQTKRMVALQNMEFKPHWC